MRSTLLNLLFFLSVSVCSAKEPILPGSDAKYPVGAKPFVFLENMGQLTNQLKQARRDIDFKLKGGDVNVFIGSGTIQYQWSKALPVSKDGQDPGFEMCGMQVSFIGANENAVIIKEEQDAYHENYYLSYCKGIASSFNKITYKDIYPKIDWVLYTRNNELKYDLIVHPGGNVADIKMKYTGDSSLVLKDGNLTAYTSLGSVTDKAPYSYEAKTKKEVSSKYEVSDGVVSFETGSYEGTLVIDPSLVWSTYYGGIFVERGKAIAKKEGPGLFDYVYVAGRTNSHDNIVLDFLPGPHRSIKIGSIADGNFDGFIGAYTLAGKQQWATYYGGAKDDAINVMVCNEAGMIYVAGGTKSDTGIATPGTYKQIAGGTVIDVGAKYNDGFIAQFDTTGKLMWGTYYGGENWDVINSMAMDENENIYITGETSSSFDIATTGTHQQYFNGGDGDAFAAKISNTGQLVWSTYLGDYNSDRAWAIVLDGEGGVYISGSTTDDTCGNAADPSRAFKIASPGCHQLLPANPPCETPPLTPIYDAFLVKFNATTGVREWGTYYGGGAIEHGYCLVYDSTNFIDAQGQKVNGIIYLGGIAGSFSAIATSTGARTTVGKGFVAAFKANGVRYWGTYMAAEVLGMVLDNNGNLHAGGVTLNQAVIASPNGVIGDAIYATKIEEGTGNHVYTTGTTYSRSFQVQGPFIQQDTLGDGSAYPQGVYGDAYVRKYTIDDPMRFRVLVANAIIHPPVPFPLKHLPERNFGSMCTGVEYDISHSNKLVIPGPLPVEVPFNAGNYFTVQLSDSSGNFQNLQNIGGGTGTASEASLIKLKIPENTPPGNNYKVRLVSNRPLAISLEETVSIHKSPYPKATGNSPVCKGDTIFLKATDSLPGVHYQWVSLDTVLFFVAKDSFIANADVTNSGKYVVTTIANETCYAMDTVSITVLPLPTITNTFNNSPVCEGRELKLNADADTVGGGTFDWWGPGYTASVQNPTFSNPAVSNAGMYYVRFTKNGCSSTDSTWVKVDTTPEVPVISGNSPICFGDTIKLDALSSTPGVKYIWKGPGNFSSSLPNPYILKATPSFSGVYSSIAWLGKCTSTDSVEIIVKEAIEPPVLSSNSPVKAGDELKLFATALTGTVYSWTGPDGFSSSDQNPIIPNVPYTATGNYNVRTVYDGCESYATTVVIVNTTSEVFFVVFPNPNNGTFSIKATMKNDQVIPLEVVNSVGQSVYRQDLVSNKRLLLETITLPGSLTTGTYYLRIRIDQSYKVVPFAVYK